jgi:hypothetical protein
VNIIDAMDEPILFAPWFQGPTWNPWKTILRAAYALPMTPQDLALFDELAGGRAPPKRRVKQLWVMGGRRGGKDSVASLIAAYAASIERAHLGHLRPGEIAFVLCIAADRSQAQTILNYTRAYFELNPDLAAMVVRQTAEGFVLDNGAEIIITTNNFRNVRGRTILLAILDEVAFWRDERSANPDTELYAAVTPGLSLDGSMLVGISTPYIKGGLLWDRFKKAYGRDDDSVLFIKATSLQLHPSDRIRALRAEAYADDPVVARSEWDVEWRNAKDGYISIERVEAMVETGITVRPPCPDIAYYGFSDSALGGAGGDSFTGAVAHREADGCLVLDCIIEVEAPFGPSDAIDRVAEMFKRYGVRNVRGDRFAVGFTIEGFLERHGIDYEATDKDRSTIYAEFLPHLLSPGRVKLLAHPKLIDQFATLQRRPTPGGKDIIDHERGAHDDLSNAAAGVLLECVVSFNAPEEIWRRIGRQELFYEKFGYDDPTGVGLPSSV